ncbi:MAG: UDP-N-acetylmuramoyl-L-alanine--D-glutamate ligase [Clostridia bacterium]
MYTNKKILVIGMAKSGLAAVEKLLSMGAIVTVCDIKNDEKIKNTSEKFRQLGAKVICGDYPSASEFDLIIPSPVIPATNPIITEAHKKNIPVISEIELGFTLTKNKIIAITGTNGKTTITAMLDFLLQHSGRRSLAVGNIGLAFSNNIDDDLYDYYVVETSSFQLENVSEFHPYIAIVNNFSRDHLERHGTLKEYRNVKMNIFKKQIKDEFVILNYDEEEVASMAKEAPSRVVFYSRKSELESGAFLRGKKIIFRYKGLDSTLFDLSDLKIAGNHNLENAMAVASAAFILGLSSKEIIAGITCFKGVEHRLEITRKINGVIFVNDSKATNPESAIVALRAIKNPIILIAGGSEKPVSYIKFAEEISTKKIKHVILIGKTSSEISLALSAVNYNNYQVEHSLDDAVIKAFDLSAVGDTVLFSPACASYDMFENFEERGIKFKKLVNSL